MLQAVISAQVFLLSGRQMFFWAQSNISKHTANVLELWRAPLILHWTTTQARAAKTVNIAMGVI